MKRLKFLIFFTIILVINTYRGSIFEKNELILNDKYEIQRIYMLGGNRKKPEIILFGPEYSMIVKEENRIYQDTDYYYGKLEKIGKIGNYWVGRNFDHKDKLKDFNSNFVSFLYLMRADEMIKKINDTIDKHEGYFIIGDDVEYFNLTYKDLQKFFNSNFIILNDAYWYIRKHGKNIEKKGEYDLSTKYYNKFVWSENKDFVESSKIYEKERIEKLLWLILLLIIQIINFVKVSKKIRKVV